MFNLVVKGLWSDAWVPQQNESGGRGGGAAVAGQFLTSTKKIMFF